MLDPSTTLFIHDVATPLAVLFAGVANAVTWYKLSLKKAAREEAEKEHVSIWRVQHQQESDERDKTIQRLDKLITEVTATNKGQEVRIKMLEDEMRDNRRNNRGRTA